MKVFAAILFTKMNFIWGAWSASWPSASLRRDAIASLSCAGFLFGSAGMSGSLGGGHKSRFKLFHSLQCLKSCTDT